MAQDATVVRPFWNFLTKPCKYRKHQNWADTEIIGACISRKVHYPHFAEPIGTRNPTTTAQWNDKAKVVP